MAFSSVHPHIRGEYIPNLARKKYIDGSSPHPWGILNLLNLGTLQGPVHPHIRGEYSFFFLAGQQPFGSSPHPWGIRIVHPIGDDRVRFIPTSVGNTCRRTLRSSRHSVHPHIRGEYGRKVHESWKTSGSSPHPWGIRTIIRIKWHVLRFIPTSVGNTKYKQHLFQGCAVHPHIRGEYST